MIEIAIPGDKALRLEHLVLDYNGTLACDGALLPGVAERIVALSRQMDVHVVTADTYGGAVVAVRDLPCRVQVLPREGQAHAKMAYTAQLGRANTVCIGNGRSDRLMLQAAALGIAVIGPEGAAFDAIHAADIVVPDILAAFDLLLKPLRLVATLRT